MSWSITLIGKPEKINEKLEEYSQKMEGQSKAEFDDAKPHLQSLVSQFLGEGVLVKLDGAGHASFTDGKKTYGTLSISLAPIYGELAL